MFNSRYRRIIFFSARVIGSIIIWDLIFPKIGLRHQSKDSRPRRLREIAARFRTLAIDMGGVMIKLGQFLSSRADVLPVEITSELAGLQDEVPAEPFHAIRGIIEAEYNAGIPAKYHQFAREPLAAASLGQVHRAILHERDVREVGFRNVVVKVQRPQIEAIIATDLAALKRVAGWIKRYRPISRRANVPALFKEFGKTLYEEIDYCAEAHNAERFAENFRDRPGVCVPRVVWHLCTDRLLVLEDVSGIKITDYAAISAAGIDRAAVARRLFDVYLQQIFEDAFFHADPHPGNLFVCPVSPGDEHDPDNTGWVLTFVDFGMVGEIQDNIRAALREMIIGLGTRETSRTIKAYQMLGVLLPHADVEAIEQAEEHIFDRFWGKSMQELQQIDYTEMHEFAHEYRDLIYDMPIQVPENILYLGRCIAILSGMCTGLYPEFNVWTGVAPYAQQLIQEEAGTLWEELRQQAGNWLKLLFSLPTHVDSTITKLDQGKLALRNPDLENRIDRLERANRKLVGTVIFTALLSGGIQLTLSGADLPGGILLGTSMLTLGWVLFS